MPIDHDAFRDAETRLTADAGIPADAISDHGVRLRTLDVTVRVREIGAGDPILFLHGGPNSGGTWTHLAAQLPGFRCLLVDRPGTGLSDPLPRPLRLGADLDTYATSLATDVLDGLDIARSHLVASSFGGMIAIRSVGAHPERFDRMVQMACPAFAPGMTTPGFMRAILSPVLRPIIASLPPNERAGRMILRQIGHAASLRAGRIPQAFHDWYLALGRHTDTMRSEQAMIGSGGTFLGGFDPSLTLTREQLAAVTIPTHFIWGEDDAFGGREVAEATVGPMPDATLEMWPEAGHLPWLDDHDRAAEVVAKFLNA